mmetsp:Transcript_13695/g.23352  ORF Transcript_13695/g.23352 Transcript_13695/m.23352 type:complete len:131 (-) Transcript_13695:76-468(-)
MVTECLFCLNLVFSYPLSIFPTNKIVEGFVFKKLKKNTPMRKWLKNISRLLVCFLGVYLSITVRNQLDKVLGITGGFLGVIIVLIVPTLCHFQIMAKTPMEKFKDLSILALSLGILFLSTYNEVKAWGSS